MRILENESSYFVQHLQSWNENLKESVRKFEKSLKINKQLFMKEVQRLNMFTPAVLLNNSDCVDENANFLQEMIREAEQENQDGNVPKDALDRVWTAASSKWGLRNKP